MVAKGKALVPSQDLSSSYWSTAVRRHAVSANIEMQAAMCNLTGGSTLAARSVVIEQIFEV